MLTKTYFRRKLAQACGLGLVLCAAAACAPQQNVRTKEEIADGWQLLFDGKTLDQWKDYNGEELTMPWHVVDGCIQAKGDGSDLAGYIVTKKQYENFILDWDWKLSHGGNSGMIYHVVEDPYFKVPYVTGPEYQLIDNEGWESGTRRASSSTTAMSSTGSTATRSSNSKPGRTTGSPASTAANGRPHPNTALRAAV